ncbi:GntR family transcriptional regulator [Bacillus cereus]|uniref:GntR family transcriptional regulator n=1 Tax=unclassified Bacillus (in: firmicutes) TaxID=185979 RepID=UPI00089690F0|nr:MULTISPECIES: GntR family transcriptional regulator [unclassified Bacillus (in: firmicutes)]PFE04459.1 GntR family transcriptional regulator [Bacillus sp. AFS023182]PGX95512.1 GntR family transcriptional regulator [Bacillus cereus]SDZ22193.1 DNA-binding transcriptional regulator YhcF, GntR family [Bacillus sp. 166amftsu]
MFITINIQSNIPIYEQLVHQIIEGIAKEELKEGETLPSVRLLASDLGVNMLTVNKAYQLLKQKGFIQIHRQKGATVNTTQLHDNSAFFERSELTLQPFIAEAKCRGISKKALLQFVQSLANHFEWEETKHGHMD